MAKQPIEACSEGSLVSSFNCFVKSSEATEVKVDCHSKESFDF